MITCNISDPCVHHHNLLENVSISLLLFAYHAYVASPVAHPARIILPAFFHGLPICVIYQHKLFLSHESEKVSSKYE